MLTKLLASKLTQQWPKQWPDPFSPRRLSSLHLSHTLVMIPEPFPHQSTASFFIFSPVADFFYNPPFKSLLLYIQLNLPL